MHLEKDGDKVRKKTEENEEKRVWRKGLLTGYVCGLSTAAILALCLWVTLGGFRLETRLRGASIGLVKKTQGIEVKQGFSDLPERYSVMGDDGKKVFVPIYQEVKKSAYDWSNLSIINQYKYYAPNGEKQCKIGIDVSKYQTDIDWNKVKESGVEFVMIRAGYRGYGTSGKIVIDDMFEKHMQGAQAAGLEVGVYFFSQAIDQKEAKEEADFVIDLIKNYKITYPVAFDSEKVENGEGRANELSTKERTEIARAFLDQVKKKGYEPMIYANDRWFVLHLDLRELTDYKLWLASYRDTPTFPYHMDVWQHTNSATVPGISGNVDMNIWFVEPDKGD